MANAKTKALKSDDKKHPFGTHYDGSAFTASVADGGRSSALHVFNNNNKKSRKLYKKLNG